GTIHRLPHAPKPKVTGLQWLPRGSCAPGEHDNHLKTYIALGRHDDLLKPESITLSLIFIRQSGILSQPVFPDSFISCERGIKHNCLQCPDTFFHLYTLKPDQPVFQ